MLNAYGRLKFSVIHLEHHCLKNYFRAGPLNLLFLKKTLNQSLFPHIEGVQEQISKEEVCFNYFHQCGLGVSTDKGNNPGIASIPGYWYTIYSYVLMCDAENHVQNGCFNKQQLSTHQFLIAKLENNNITLINLELGHKK